MERSDWELVQKCQAGEMDAFQELVSRYHQKVYMVILGLLRNREDALEVAQETFFRAFRKIKSFQGGQSVDRCAAASKEKSVRLSRIHGRGVGSAK